jgi:uncharacterized protein (TIGR02145 family)
MKTKRFILLAVGVSLASIFIYSCSSDTENSSLEYGGRKYRTVILGSQHWMAENLNFEVPGSRCYGDNPANCGIYGRLYNWSTAMALPYSCSNIFCANQISTPHRGICPEGWHIPTNEEWSTLYSFANNASNTSSSYENVASGKHLKAKEGWNNCHVSGSAYSCFDTYGFSALPGGFGFSSDGSSAVGDYGYWWSASEHDIDASHAYGSYMHQRSDVADWYYGIKTYLFSVRCLQD